MSKASNNLSASKKVLAITGVFISLFIPAALLFFAGQGIMDAKWFEVFFWLIPVLLILYNLFIEKLPLSAIGFRRLSLKKVLIGITSGGLIVALFPLSYMLMRRLNIPVISDTIIYISSLPLFPVFLLAMRAAISEEIIYRAYAIERLLMLTKHKTLAAGIPLVVFILSHVNLGIGAMLFVAVAGILLSWIYLQKRNVWVNIIAHFIADVSVFILSPELFGLN